MKQLIVILWSLVLGQVVGYLGAALNNGVYNFFYTTLASFILAILVILISEVAVPKKEKAEK